MRQNVARKLIASHLEQGQMAPGAEIADRGGHAVVGGHNYGQGSSREHAALAPRYLGLRVVIAKSFARIHWQNLVSFGIVPLTFTEESDYHEMEQDNVLRIENLRDQIVAGAGVVVDNRTRSQPLATRHSLSARQVQVLLAGGLINFVKSQRETADSPTR
jgi:aconitate hydratase